MSAQFRTDGTFRIVVEEGILMSFSRWSGHNGAIVDVNVGRTLVSLKRWMLKQDISIQGRRPLK